jgi:hypothetical protein
MPGQISIGGFSRFISQNPTPGVYPLGFAAEGGQEKIRAVLPAIQRRHAQVEASSVC